MRRAGIVQVSACANQSFALRSDGAVFSWGDNTYGALGLRHNQATDHPAQIDSLSRIVSIAAGDHHAIALDQDGAVCPALHHAKKAASRGRLSCSS